MRQQTALISSVRLQRGLGLALVVVWSLLSGVGYAQEAVVNGDFSSTSTGWTTWRAQTAVVTRSFTSTLVPTGGVPPCLTVSTTSSSSGVIGGGWQALNLIPGTSYTISVLCRANEPYMSPLIMAKVLVGLDPPVNYQVYDQYTPGTTLLLAWGLINDPSQCSWDPWDGNQNTACLKQVSFVATAPTMYLMLQAGSSYDMSSGLYVPPGYGYGDPFSVSFDNVSIVPGTDPSAIDPPPMPPDYVMGNVVNGDFETDGGSLTGWSTSCSSYESSVGLYSPTGSQEHVARMHATGEWSMMPGPMGETWWDYMSGTASVSQTVFFPSDATTLSFSYITREEAELSGDPTARISIGGTSQTFTDAADWMRATMSVPAAAKGRRTTVTFSAEDGGSAYMYPAPGGQNVMDLYVDFIGIDGSASLQTTTWSASGGGSWENPSSWNPSGIPDNSPSIAHDVVIPESASGADSITIGSPHTIQTFKNDRRADWLQVQTGGSLHVVEDAWMTGANVQVQPGGSITIEEDMIVSGGSLSLHPEGSVTGGQPLAVGGTLTVQKDSVTSAPGTVVMQDGTVQTGAFTVKSGSSCTLSSPSVTGGQTQLQVTGSMYLGDYSGTGCSLILQPGTSLLVRSLGVYSGNTLQVQSATITGQPSSYGVSGSGIAQFTGDGCRVEQISFSNSGTLTFTNAQAVFTSSVYASGTTQLTNSTVTVEGDLSVSGSPTADAASTLRFKKKLSNYSSTPTTFNLTSACLEYAGTTLSQMTVLGIDAGPFATGLDNNFGVGRLVVGSGTLQFTQTGSGHAQYVQDLVLAAGATLDLNGIPLYYTNSFTDLGGSVTGGQVIRAYPRPEGLPEPAFASDYTAHAEAIDVTQTVTGGPASAYGWSGGGGPEMGYSSASSSVQAGSNTGYRTVKIDVSGDSFFGPMGPPPLAATALGSFASGLSLPPSEQYPEGSPIDLMITASLWGYAGSTRTWFCKIYHGEDLLDTLEADQTSSQLALSVGDVGLRIEVSVSDSVPAESYGSFSDHLLVTLYSLSVELADADFNADRYVDHDDLDIFEICATGPGVPYAVDGVPPECGPSKDSPAHIAADLDADGDVDQLDFAILQRCYRGENEPADPACTE